MQTFLPFDDFHASAEALDTKRLGKQRLEARQLLQVLHSGQGGWLNHPAARMWKGFEAALTDYMNVCITEWKKRGFKNTMIIVPVCEVVRLPDWFGSTQFHLSHKSNLVRKDPVFYGPKFPGVLAGMPYFWPK